MSISKCYLLGAGASYGHSPDLSDEERPPMRGDLFADGLENGLFESEDFELLLKYVIHYLDLETTVDEVDPDDLSCDEEDLLAELYRSLDEEGDHLYPYRQYSASLVFYYFYELFRQYSNSFAPEGSYYEDLANHFQTEDYAVISLNYDVMLEKAISHTGQSWYYPRSQSQTGIPIVKLHGSINMLNNFSGIQWNDRGYFPERVRNVVRNSDWGGWQNITLLNYDQLQRYDYHDLGYEFDTLVEPVLIPPYGPEKNYAKVMIYQYMFEFAAEILQSIDELVIIGTSVAEDDQHLIDLLKSNVDDDVTLTIATGGDSDNLQERVFPEAEYQPLDADSPYFRHYVESRLS